MSSSSRTRERRRKHPVLERAEYAVYRLISWPLRRGGEERTRKWALVAARAMRRLSKRRDQLARRNLARVLPELSDQRREEILTQCWQHFARVVFGFVRDADRHTPETYEIIGRDHLDTALSKGRGVIIVTAHWGDWERALGALEQLDTPVCVVARRLDNRLLERDLYRIRTRTNVELIDRRKAARPLYRTLQAKGVAVMLADQAVKPREGILVPFLGAPAWTTPAPARLSLKTGAPLVIVWCASSSGISTIELEEPIDPDILQHYDRTAEGITRRINDRLTERIRRQPEMWLWMHDRWKGTQGTGGASRREPTTT